MYAIVFHAHQKLDKVAYRHLIKLLPPTSFFPTIKQIIDFDGPKGPDGAKLKRQVDIDQPWHFIDPYDPADDKLEKQIENHYRQLIDSLKAKDDIRSAFEAAWLAHALVDGLTPAHHYPYEEELEKLRGESKDTRRGIIGRAFVKGETMSQTLVRSLKLVGPKGLVTTHAMFEAGAYAIIGPLKLTKALPGPDELAKVLNDGIGSTFRELVREVADYDLFGRFYLTGWTRTLNRDVRRELAPRMAKMITLAWYAASIEAGV